MEKILNFLTVDEINENIDLTSIEDSDKLISLLEQINCKEETIKHIILSNPNYLKRDYKDILNLINKLYSLGLTDLYVIFESNPYLLNKDAFEIDEFIEEKLHEGLTLNKIIDIIDSESDLID